MNSRREKDLSTASKRSPSIEAQLESDGRSGTIVVRHANVQSLRVNYYLMDIEFLFSSNPFVGGSNGSSDSKQHFSFVRPNHTLHVKLEDGTDETRLGVPSDIIGDRDHIVEIMSQGQREVVPVFRSKMSVNITETTGRLRVTIGGRSAPRCYVKVYGDFGGNARFYKDGYTDIRGCFDYVSLDTDQLSRVSRFSILISSPSSGALIKEAKPPPAASRNPGI